MSLTRAAIGVGDKANLVAVIEAVIAAVRAGELDAALGGIETVREKAVQSVKVRAA